jgi:hypothetical protein
MTQHACGVRGVYREFTHVLRKYLKISIKSYAKQSGEKGIFPERKGIKLSKMTAHVREDPS